MDDSDNEDAHQVRHPAIEVSLTHSIEQLRHLAYEATPPPEELLSAQRLLLRTATAVIARKGLSTDTETYRRLGILIPHWKHPAQFESALHLLQDYWRHHRFSRSLGRSSTFIMVRVKAANYLKKLAAGEEIEAGIADDEDLLNEIENEFNIDPRKCTLPSATMVRVFRLVNGNLEIPATLFKALAVAGRIRDAFFPDEMSTWEPGPAGHGLGGGCDLDAESDGSYNGTQTDIPSSDAGEDEDSSSDSSEDDDNDDGGNDAVFVDPYDTEEAPHVENSARQATADFFQQMQVARVGSNNGEGSSNNSNGGNNNGGSGNGGGGLFGGMDFSVLPEVVRRMFGPGNSPAPAPAVPVAPPPVPNFVFCPMPIMMMPMQIQMQMQVNMQMGQTGNNGAMGNAMMDAMQNMMKQMSGKGSEGAFNFNNSNKLLTDGSGTRKAKSRSIIEIKSDDEDGEESVVGSSQSRSASSSGTKRSSSSAWSGSSSSSKRFKTSKSESSSGATSSSTPYSSSASSTAIPPAKTPRRPRPTSRPSPPPKPPTFASAYDASSTVPSSSSSHVHIPSYRPSSSPAFNYINSAEKKKETFTEFQQRRLRQAERMREKEAARKKGKAVFK